MSFKEVMERVGQRVDDARGIVVIGDDGIIVERILLDPTFDSELASVEYMGGYKGIEKAANALQAGNIEEIAVVAASRALWRGRARRWLLGGVGHGRAE